MRRITLFVATLIAALSLTACSGGGQVLGDSQEVSVTGVNVKAEMVVSAVDTMPLADVEGIKISGLDDGTLFLVHSSLKLAGGDFTEVTTAHFNYRHWSAKGSHEIKVVDPGYFQKPEVEGCHLYDEAIVSSLTAGDEVQFCQIFASADQGATIESVTFRKSGIQQNPSWTWKVG